MSFFYPDKDKFIDGNISYNYPLTNIYKRDIEEKKTYSETIKKPNTFVELEGDLIDIKDDYFVMDFKGRENQFQDVKIGSNTFFSKKLYIYGLLHNNISDVIDKDTVGEIVIEHTDLAPKKQRIFTCFLLKNRGDYVENSLDKLINMVKNKNNQKDDTFELGLELNKDIPEQDRVIKYVNSSVDSNKHIYIFLEPILVNKDSAELLKQLTYSTSLFSVEAPLDKIYLSGNFSAKSKTADKEGFSSMNVVEGMDSYYFDCNPAGESDETTPSYVVPIESEYTNSKVKMGSLQVFLHLLLFAFISVVIFFIVPPTYKTFIIDSFIKKYPGNGPEVYAGVYGFDLFVIVLLHIVIFFFMIGAGLNLPMFFLTGITLLVIFMMTTFIIMFAKGSDSYWKTGSKSVPKPTKDDSDNLSFTNIGIILNLMKERIMTPKMSTALLVILNIISVCIYLPITHQKGIKGDRVALIAVTSFLLTIPFFAIAAVYEFGIEE
tara:strand:+ start:3136 stop:4605 length:1470 start_codon:yes stop_codon:yes gene_type:complete